MNPSTDQDATAGAPPPRHHDKSRGAPLAWILALAYTLVIVYASLQPFQDWRRPPPEILRFLTAPWPYYITVEDLLFNIVAYAPLGFLLALGLNARVSALPAVLGGTALAALISLAMEGTQMFLPARIVSNVDLLTNSVGSLIGAMAAPLLSPVGFPGRRLNEWRERVIPPGTLADTGLVIVFLWLLTQLHPTAQLFGTGDLRATFGMPARFAHTPQLLFAAEAAIVFLNLLGLGLLMSALMRESVRQFRVVVAIIGTGLVAKSAVAITLFDPAKALVWLTPGVALGLGAGALLVYALVRMPRLGKLAVAFVCFGAALAAINLAPENPYQTVPLKLIPREPTHFLRFSNIARALSELWQFLALGYLFAAMARGKSRR